MNKIILNYIIKNFLKSFFIIMIVFFCFGIILNLFEEIEFFKSLDVNFFTPLVLTSMIVPGIIIQSLPFIIFISSMWFMLKIRNNKDLLILKVYGYSNLKIFFILATTSFILGWLVLVLVSPITSSLTKFYEKTKSNYSKETNHLISFNKNGIWIKESLNNNQRIISADKLNNYDLINVTIFHLDSEYQLIEKISSERINIKDFDWEIDQARIFKFEDNIFKSKETTNLKIKSVYNYDKITNLFKNFETISFLDLTLRYNKLISNGYNSLFLKQTLNTHLSLPFLLLLMTGIAAILTMHTLKDSNNLTYIILGLIVVVVVFYFKDLSLALGKTARISMTLSIWAPVIILSFFSFIGILQINEK